MTHPSIAAVGALAPSSKPPTLAAPRAWARRLPPSVWRGLSAARRGSYPYGIVAFHRVWEGSCDELSYPPLAFDALCRYFRDHFEVIPLDTLLARLAHGDPGPSASSSPSLVITFDDGYADNFEFAAPILDRYNLSATFFVTTRFIGTVHRFAWDRDLPSTPPLMSWEQVRQLHAAGFNIGAHTATHVRISETPPEALALELREPLRKLRQELALEGALGGENGMGGPGGTGPQIDFAYPFGGVSDCNASARAQVRGAGYRCCLSCHGGLIGDGDSPFALNRVCVSPRHHATPRDWARAYARLRWQHRR